MRLHTRLNHRDLLKPLLLLAFALIVTSGTSTFAINQEWKQIDHSGTICGAINPNTRVPAWTDWKEKTEKSDTGDEKYRYKTNNDGTECRFYYSSMWGPPCLDRFSVEIRSRDGQCKYGFADRSGKIIVPPEYTQVEHYYNGLVAVQKSNGSPWLLLDKSGQLRYKLPNDMKPQFHSGFWGVTLDGIMPVSRGGPDNDSPERVSGLYDLKRKKFYPVGNYIVFNNFSEGLSCIDLTGSKHGYINAKGKTVIAARFDEASAFKEGVALVRLGAQRGFIDHTGKFVAKLPARCVDAGPLREGLVAVSIKNSKGEPKWGFVDKTGNVVIPPSYWVDVRWFNYNPPAFSEGLAAVAIGDDVHHKYGYLDKTGKFKIAPQFKNATGFVDGLAQVQTGDSGFNKADWNERQGRYVCRVDAFYLYVKQFGLLGESKSEVLKALGEPDKIVSKGAVYNLVTSFCGNAYQGVEIHFDNDRVTKYRTLSFQKEGEWIKSLDKQLPDSNLCPVPLRSVEKLRSE